MDRGYWAHRIYELLTRKDTGLIALVAAIVGIVKAFVEIRKLRSDLRKSASDMQLNQINARLKELELRDRIEQKPEVMSSLDAIRDSATALYKDLITAYEPFLPNPSKRLTKADSRKNVAAVQKFAREQAHRPLIRENEQALSNLVSPGEDGPLRNVLDSTRALLDAIEHGPDPEDPCYINRIGEGPLDPDVHIKITEWVNSLKALYDKLIFDIGSSRYRRSTPDTAAVTAKK